MKIRPSPILYPGGKSWLFNDLLGYIPDGVTEIVSPFMGGGVIELNLALQGITVHAGDKFGILVNFWNHFLRDAEGVVKGALDKARGHTGETLYNLSVNFDEIKNDYDRSVYYYLLNRLSFGGKVFHGRYACKFEFRDGLLVKIRRRDVRRVIPQNVSFWFGLRLPLFLSKDGFEQTLDKYPDSFAYLDPPYPVKNQLYGKGKSKMNHCLLAEILRGRDRWVLSYNDHHSIRRLYRGYCTIITKRRSQLGKRNIKEVLIFSNDIAGRAECWSQMSFDFRGLDIAKRG